MSAKCESLRNPETDWSDTVFDTRYQAEVARKYSLYHDSSDVIVKVHCVGGGIGYILMPYDQYLCWRKL